MHHLQDLFTLVKPFKHLQISPVYTLTVITFTFTEYIQLLKIKMLLCVQ